MISECGKEEDDEEMIGLVLAIMKLSLSEIPFLLCPRIIICSFSFRAVSH